MFFFEVILGVLGRSVNFNITKISIGTARVSRLSVSCDHGFTKILNVKICVFKSVLSLRSENAGPVTRDHIKSSHMRNETTLQL